MSDGGEKRIYIGVRTDLGMSAGKLVAQAGHAVVGLYDTSLRYGSVEEFGGVLEYVRGAGQVKIAVRVDSLEELMRVEKECKEQGVRSYVVHDAGRSEVDPGTETVIAFGPVSREDLLGGLRRLRVLDLEIKYD